MTLRTARPEDAQAILDIYAPVVRDTAISFEVEPPSLAAMRERISATTATYPWLVSVDAAGTVDGYVYATRHKERAAYRWSVEVTAYVRHDARGRGVGRRLYTRLLQELAALGYHQAFAVIVLPNAGSVALHEAVGFEPVGVCRRAGYKLGRWWDVGWWQAQVQPLELPGEPRAFDPSGADSRA
ncbi:MAG: arsinothricin resistance N-acetyltransferase ArsN1 family B [Rubrivivax sp.]